MLYNKIKNVDWILLIFTLIACAGGIVLAFSLVDTNSYQQISSGISPSIWKTKILAFALGLISFVILSFISIDRITKRWKIIGAVGVFFTLLTFTPLGTGPTGSDDRAWLSFLGYTVQPAEVLKLCFIITFSVHITYVKKHFNKPLTILGLIAHALFPILIVYFQGDQGTGLIFGLIAIVMMFAGGLSWKYVVTALVLSPLIIWAGWKWILQEHQKDRIMVLFNPELDPLGVGYQQAQGEKALQSGGILGKGLFSGDTQDFIYVSESQNDFIFSYAGQTLGFVGCGLIIVILFIICIRLVANSSKLSQPGSSICAGVFGLIFSHTFINIGMVLGVMPVIGVPLPFFSSGGTAMVTMLVAMGLVQSSLKKSDSISDNKKTNSNIVN